MNNSLLCFGRATCGQAIWIKSGSQKKKAAFYCRCLLFTALFYTTDIGEAKSNPHEIKPVARKCIAVNALEYAEGDYRPLVNNTDFSKGGSSPYQWETFVSGSWVPTSVSPQSIKPSRIIIDKTGINGAASASNSYNDIVVVNGGELIITDKAVMPASDFVNASKTLEIQGGGKLIINGDIKLSKTTFWLMRNGSSLIIDHNAISNVHPMWNGLETFEAGSTVTIRDWKWNATFNERSLIEDANIISNNNNGYKFGNLILDINPTSVWTMISGATGIINLCENDLYINNASSNFITGASNETGINGFVVNGNMTINKGPFGFGSSFSGGNFNHQFIINGTFECKSTSALKIHHTVASTPATLNGFVTFRNNVTIAPTVNAFSNDAASVTMQPTKRMYINLNGGTLLNPLYLDVAPPLTAISINIKPDSYVQLKGHDLDTRSTTGNTAVTTVETGATLDFGWAPDGITPLVIKKNVTGGTNNFVTQQGSILKITSPDGISETTAGGNVQYTGGANKTFNQAATFWYTGKVNQVTGDGLGNSGSARQVIIDMDNNSLSTTLTQPFRLTNATTASPTGGKLDIRKGQFLETPTAYIEGVLNENGSGTLYMSPGTLYRISSLSSADVQPNIPRMSGVSFPYKLDGGTIELSAAGDQTLRGNKAYRNLTFANSGVKTVSSAPTSITGTILIKDDATLNVAANAMGGAGTNLTMTGNSKYITAGVLTKPDAQGTYALGPGTTIEFANSNNVTLQQIRLGLSSENPIMYNHIIISGNNVGNTSLASTPVMMQSGSSFKVTGTGVFRHYNINGFSGAANTCITDVPTVYLDEASSIDYNRPDGNNQNISNNVAYKNLLLSGAGNKIATPGNLVVEGNFIKSGSADFIHNNGTVIFNGSALQSVSCSLPEILFNNLTINSISGVSVNSNISIYKQLLLGSAAKLILNTGDITLRSDKNNTANVAKIPVNTTITYNSGLVVVERYINSGLKINGQHTKSWQFLSTPVFGESIRSTWQENKSAISNYGTWITNNDIASWSAQGFDGYSIAPSMKSYNSINNTWTGIPNTNINLENALGYMLFVRGDRTVTTTGQDAKPTTLRARGKLYAPQPGFSPPSTSVRPNSYESIGNPYASRIDLEYMFNNNLISGVDDSFYTWDPTLSGSYGVGGYQTISKSLGYRPVPGVPGNPTQYYDPEVKANFIESGQAFFVHNSSATNGMVAFNENCKASGSRLVNKESNGVASVQSLRTYLYTEDDDIADGNAVVFGDNFSNAIDYNDALKILNGGENFGLFREEQIIAVEARQRINTSDTLFYYFNNLKRQNYRLRFFAENMRNEFDVTLVDRFLNSKKPVSFYDSSFHSFSITSEAASELADRFMLLLTRRVALPLSVTAFKAFLQNTIVSLRWQIENENNLSNYILERSPDGIHFLVANEQVAKNQSFGDYTWRDTKPYKGLNYYRLKIVDVDGQISFSEIIKVYFRKENPSIKVFPNPVKGGIVKLQFINQPDGNYRVSIFNSLGQLIASKEIDHVADECVKSFPLENRIAKGIYFIEINKPSGGKYVSRIRIN